MNKAYNKNYKNWYKKFVTQAEIDKMSDYEKFFPPCKCGKPRQSRWMESTLLDEKGWFYAIMAYKGKNGEEVCHRCAPCVKCGKEAVGNNFHKDERTNANPTGEWGLAYCANCFYGTEKPSLLKKEPKQTLKCDQCGKLCERNIDNAKTGKFFCSGFCQSWWQIHNGDNNNQCRIAGCSKKAYYASLDLCLGHSKPCRKIKPNGKICNAALGIDEGDFCEFCKNQNELVDKKENSRNCSHCGKLFAGEVQYSCSPCGTIYCSKDCCETSAPQCKNKQGKESQDNQAKPVKFIVDSEKNLDKSPEKLSDEGKNQTLIINLRSVKQITLTSENNLVIEFNKTETNSVSQSTSQEAKILSDKQISSSQELQKIKGFLQASEEKSINQQKLNSLFGFDSTNPGITDKPDNYRLAVGLSLIAALSGLTIVLVKRKLKAVRK